MTNPPIQVPLVDLRAAFARDRQEVLQAFEAVLEDMNLLLGPNVEALEREFSAYCGTAHGVAVSSGTDALYAALRACRIGAGDEVIVPSHTFFATVEAVIHVGATPVMVDVEPDRLTMDPGEARRALTPATRAILPVHLYGHPADMDPLLALAAERDLRVIEDASQAHGARYRGRRCGGLGDAGCFSFYFTKNLGALGEGGFVTSLDREIAERVALLRHHGHTSKFEHALVGHNLRMDELQAAVLRIRLRRLDESLERRRSVAERYERHFRGAPLRTVRPREDCEPAWHVYAIRVEERDELIEHLTSKGIGSGIHYRTPAHQQPALRGHAHRVGAMTVTERACQELVSLPIYPELAEEQVDYVAREVLEFLGRRGRRSRVGAGGAGFEVSVLPASDDSVDAELDAFFDACPTSFAQQTRPWRNVITRTAPDLPLFLGCRRAGELVGVLPAYRFQGPLGAILTSVPQAGPLGGVACHPQVEAEPVYAGLLEAYRDLARSRGCALASVISNPFWPDRELYQRYLEPDYTLENTCQALDLHEAVGADGEIRATSGNLKRNLRRAEAGGLRIDEEQSHANLDAWYEIHAARHREIGATPLPRQLFSAALQEAVPRGKAHFVFVRLADSGEMVAGGFYVHHGQVIDALMPSVATAHARLGASYLMAAHTIRWARSQGLRWYNWQASPPDGGVERFKRQWGSRDFGYGYFTRVTGDAAALQASSVAEIRRGYPWHFVLPFDRLGVAEGSGASSRQSAWRAQEGAGP